PEEELVKRILLRGKDSGRADDASEDVIRNRIKIYNEQTAVVADYYKAQGKYESVPSLGTIDEVFARICAVVEKTMK
ncbi:MAG: adenylate kinase, partial [Alistipes sp.]|nr:adenylate kinase [Alistipes sp.]